MCYAASLRGESPSLVELKATTENPVVYWVVVPDQERQEIYFDNDNTVFKLKQAIWDKFGIPIDKQKLTYRGYDIWGDNQKMKEYPAILSGDTIDVALI